MRKNNYIKIAGFLVSLSILLIPLSFSFALDTGGNSTIANPLKSKDITVILKDILSIVVKVGAIIVIFFIIWSGFNIVTSHGNEGKLTKAKEMFWTTIIGGAILLGADVIATVVVNTVETTTGTK